jgi:hypothetical protein
MKNRLASLIIFNTVVALGLITIPVVLIAWAYEKIEDL